MSKRVASVVRALRLRQGWTQEALAQQVGVTDRTIRRVERGEGLDDETRSALEGVLGLEPGQLLRLEGPGWSFYSDGNPVLHLVTDAESYAKAMLGSQMTFVEPNIDGEEHEPLIERLLTLIDDSFLWDALPASTRYSDETKITDVVGALEKRDWRVVVMRKPGTTEIGGQPLSAASITLRIYRVQQGDDPLAGALRAWGPQEMKPELLPEALRQAGG